MEVVKTSFVKWGLPSCASQVESQVTKRRVSKGAEDTSNDPYGVGKYGYSVPMNEDVDEKALPRVDFDS